MTSWGLIPPVSLDRGDHDVTSTSDPDSRELGTVELLGGVS